ncbi:hypothetical protein RDI58_018381 [Solanum bulbocastanum]|uniref:Uncharacterized protein n=1 Tax=Solanum bulbocastanum TaxID=147425 RepID=A0AAN8TJG6_SOLBU
MRGSDDSSKEVVEHVRKTEFLLSFKWRGHIWENPNLRYLSLPLWSYLMIEMC